MLKGLNYMLAVRYRVENYDALEASRILKCLDLTKKCSPRPSVHKKGLDPFQSWASIVHRQLRNL